MKTNCIILFYTFTINFQMFEIRFFPVYGFALGVNYWDSEMDDNYDNSIETTHMIQVFLTLFGISIIWYKDI